MSKEQACLTPDDGMPLKNKNLYKEVTGKLLYLSTATRPDISAAIGGILNRKTNSSFSPMDSFPAPQAGQSHPTGRSKIGKKGQRSGFEIRVCLKQKTLENGLEKELKSCQKAGWPEKKHYASKKRLFPTEG